MEWLGWIALGGTALGWVAMVLACVGLLLQRRDHFSLRPRGLALEAERLARPLPPEEELPHVVVQLPTFNEGEVVRRAVANAVGLDWPRDKLHVQVCDDSTDGTTEVAEEAARQAREEGYDVTVVRRGSRQGFKAGALQNAMERTEHEYFLILDVDFVSPNDFLQRLMGVLLSEPEVAFVQARPDFFNRRENVLTRAQAIFLDWHYGLEQPTRAWSGHILPFNGTCGIWRRAAIQAAGGWRGDTLTEDWDLSYRAWQAGWKGAFLATVSAFGELPHRVAPFARQQRRWATGVGEVGFRAIRDLVGSGDISTALREGKARPFGMWLAHATFPGTVPVAVLAMLLHPSMALYLAVLVYLPYAAATVVLYGVTWSANRSLARDTRPGSFFMDFLPVPFLFLYLGWANLRSLPSTLLGRTRIFMRTPKRKTSPARP